LKYRKSSGFLNYPSLYQRIARKILTGSGCLKTAGRMAGYCLIAPAQCRLMGGRIPGIIGSIAPCSLEISVPGRFILRGIGRQNEDRAFLKRR